jgi:hypothetical protein
MPAIDGTESAERGWFEQARLSLTPQHYISGPKLVMHSELGFMARNPMGERINEFESFAIVES